MASEMILKIKEAEEQAEAKKQETAEHVRNALEAAEAEGDRLLCEAREQAKQIRDEIVKEAEAAAAGAADKKRTSTRVETGILISEANAHMDAAVDVIVKEVLDKWQ